MKEAVPHAELSPKVGEGANRAGGISWRCLTPPLLHRGSDMPCPTNVVRVIQAGAFDGQLTDGGGFPRQARGVDDALCATANLPEWEVMTGIGPVAVRQPRVWGRDAATNPKNRQKVAHTTAPE
jgi:hypothetical protein